MLINMKAWGSVNWDKIIYNYKMKKGILQLILIGSINNQFYSSPYNFQFISFLLFFFFLFNLKNNYFFKLNN